VSENSSTNEAYELAVRFLARREHSRHELRVKLRQRGVSSSAVESVLDTLETNGLQSDDRYTEICVRSRLRKGHGPLKIRAYLQHHGVQNSKISEHLSSNEEYWFKRALESDTKCRVRNQIEQENARDQEVLQVRARYLSNRGYPANVISRVLNSPA